MTTIEEQMRKSFFDHFFNGEEVEILEKTPNNKIISTIKTMGRKEYWTRVNLIEAYGFTIRISIIFPGLLFNKSWWWLYIFAIIASFLLIWTSTKKTLPTIILFNMMWIVLSVLFITKHFWWGQ
jgi:hypothetical protein